GSPMLYLESPQESPPADQRGMLDFVQWLNRNHQSARGADTDDLSARIASYELAFRMQAAVPEAVDLTKESSTTKELYGCDGKVWGVYARNCLMARRLVERGVRFVQIFTGGAGADDWDAAHADNDRVHDQMARRTDRPTAALLTDLKTRGLLDSTLVI